jgi:N-acetylglutamate synthase-like GNAT family acetyltransferase
VRTEIAIREARPEDAEAVAELLGELGYPTDAPRFERRLERIERDPSSQLFVATVNDRVAGLAGVHLLPLVEHDEPGCQLTALVVGRAYRRTGVGSELVRTIEREAQSRGGRRVFVNTARHREVAHAFYEQLGFEATGLRFIKDVG